MPAFQKTMRSSKMLLISYILGSCSWNHSTCRAVVVERSRAPCLIGILGMLKVEGLNLRHLETFFSFRNVEIRYAQPQFLAGSDTKSTPDRSGGPHQSTDGPCKKLFIDMASGRSGTRVWRTKLPYMELPLQWIVWSCKQSLNRLNHPSTLPPFLPSFQCPSFFVSKLFSQL